MPIITLTFPPGSVAEVSGNNPVTVDSVNTVDIVININDVNGDGLIDNAEWDAYTTGGGGADTGASTYLYDQNTGNAGTLYDTTGSSFTVGQDVDAIADSLSNSFQADVSAVDCFVTGTRILTQHGERRVETLKVGDLLATQDHDLQVIRWIGCQKITQKQMRANESLCPIRIRAGALGANLPKQDLWVSRQHRLLVRSPIAVRMFDIRDYLIPAIKQTILPGISIEVPEHDIAYYHLLLDRHEILFAESAPTESLFTGPEALKSVSLQDAIMLRELFPALNDADYSPDPASFIPPNKQQRRLIERHAKNKKPLLV
ncbi:Hint domain-containing protein [Yoonia sp. I 8.24]|uniref:Hint domain-containing protein n=1 Tax=Yoonia sp. I 8.24 TaxID=1537229 RepID=UPI001EDDAFE7|nr:Hint domain-containing protein [Yoonia sp. I 8.24]MCG3269245.1 Hint domain-containing protein [Yoonia sp. I 8.24]